MFMLQFEVKDLAVSFVANSIRQNLNWWLLESFIQSHVPMDSRKGHKADWKLKQGKTENQYWLIENDDVMNLHHGNQNDRKIVLV